MAYSTLYSIVCILKAAKTALKLRFLSITTYLIIKYEKNHRRYLIHFHKRAFTCINLLTHESQPVHKYICIYMAI